MTDHDSSGNSIWLGIFVLLLPVLGASLFLNWRMYSQVVAMQAEIDELHGQIEAIEQRRIMQAILEAARAEERQRKEPGGGLILDP